MRAREERQKVVSRANLCAIQLGLAIVLQRRLRAAGLERACLAVQQRRVGNRIGDLERVGIVALDFGHA